jgi:excisionase family DNA binding protein
MTTKTGPNGPSAIVAPRLISLSEAAERLGCSRGLLWRLRREGRIRTVGLGRRALIPETELHRIAAGEEGGAR